MNRPGILSARPASETRAVPLRYWLVLWLLVVSAIAFLDRTNIAVAGVQIGKDFRIDNSHLGWIFSAFLIGYAAFQIPGGMLVDRFGARAVLTLSVLWWGAFTALTAAVPVTVRGALAILIAIRFMLGAGEATMYPATNRFVARWFPRAERGKANGIIFGGVGLGSTIAPPLVTALILRYGWRASFCICGGIGVVAGLIWQTIARDTPEEHPAVRAGELDKIVRERDDPDDATVAGPRNSNLRSTTPWRAILRSKEVLALTGSYFTYGYVAWIFFSWFYIYLAEVRKLNLHTTALYSMLPFAAMTVGSIGGGAVSDWITRHYGERAGRCWFGAFALGLTAVLLLAGAHASGTVTATLVLAGGAGALYLSQSCYWSISADFAGEHAGVVSGTMNAGAQVGGAVTASLTPLIAAHLGWNASFLTATVLAVAGAAAWLAIDPERRLADS